MRPLRSSSAIIIADDNIEGFVVETTKPTWNTNETLLTNKPTQHGLGKAGLGKWVGFQRHLDFREAEDPLEGTGLHLVTEPELRRFLRGALPQLTVKRNAVGTIQKCGEREI